MKVVGYRPYAPAVFIPMIILVHMELSDATATPGIDPGNFRLVAKFLNHYATPGSDYKGYI